MFQVRHIIVRGALFMISLLLLGYLGFLLLNLYRSYNQINQAAIEQLQHYAEKRAILLESFLKDRSEDLVDLSEKQQLSSYFENLSLGMSLEYGLGASIEELSRTFELYRLRKLLDGRAIYQRIMFVDARGNVLADSSEYGLATPSQSSLMMYKAQRTAGTRMYLAKDSSPVEIVLAVPYYFKGSYSGHILSWIRLGAIYSHFIQYSDSVSDTVSTVTFLHDTHNYIACPPKRNGCPITVSSVPAPDKLKNGRQSFEQSSDLKLESFTLQIPGTPVFLTNFVQKERSDGTSAIRLVVTTGTIGVLILLAAILVFRTDMHFRVIETRLEETRLREEATEAANTALRETAGQLKESKERLTLALEGADLGLWDWHIPDGRVAYSEQWASMLGYRLSDLEPSVNTWEKLVHPDDLPEVKQVLQQHLDGGTPFYETEHRCLTNDGGWLWILDRGRVVERDTDGKPLRMAGTHLDITDRKNAEERLRQLNEALEEKVQEEVRKNREKDAYLLQQDKMASIGQLAAGVAHEINNPIGFIISNMSTLKDYSIVIVEYIDSIENLIGTRPELLEEMNRLWQRLDIQFIKSDLSPLLDESLEGADRVKQIVRDLKDFARIDEATVKDTDLNQCVRSTVNIVRNEIKYVANLELQLGDIPMVVCNPQQINQVITNLLVNAAQAIDGHGVITVTTAVDEKDVILKISDTGHGIPSDLLGRIFDPFFTTKPVGQGTGLGLTISYDIVKKNGGDITVQSEPGKGTVFTVTLPTGASTVTV